MSGARSTVQELWLIHAIGAAACVGVTIAVYALVFAPRLDAMQAYAAREQVLMARSLDASQRADEARRVANRVEHVRRDLAEFPVVLEGPEEINARLAVMNDLAARHAIDVELLSVQEPLVLDQYSTVPIRLRGRADFHEAMQFLRGLRTDMPNTGIASFALVAPRSRTAAGLLLELRLVWYARRDAAPTLAGAEADGERR